MEKTSIKEELPVVASPEVETVEEVAEVVVATVVETMPVVEATPVVEAVVEAPVVSERPARKATYNNNQGGGRSNDRPQRKFDRDKEKEFEERVVKIKRVTKVVKGGRNFRFSALVVVGDKKGRVGMGTGKASEVPDAIKKAVENAKKNVFKVSIVGTTLPHVVTGRYGAGEVLLRPASEGTGVIAGGPVRAVLELAGVQDVLSKCIGSRTPINMVRATVVGLQSLKTLEKVSRLRGLKPEEVRK